MTVEYNPVSQYALRGLKTCWMDDEKRFSHAYRLDPKPHNVSVPESDTYYTLNVLLGLAALPDGGKASGFDVSGIFLDCCESMPNLPVPKYAFGMAMWVAAETGLDLPPQIRSHVAGMLDQPDTWRHFAAQDIGLMVSGLSRLHAAGFTDFAKGTGELYEFMSTQFGNTGSGLFFNNCQGFRRRYATYATGVYSTLACLHYGDAFDDGAAIERGLSCARTLGARQGVNGEWPWFYDAQSGIVVDPYQVYSVHQDGMAPAYLHLADRLGMAEARDQIEKGFHWIFGANELGRSMLVPSDGLVLRSHRRSESFERHRRAVRGVVNAAANREGRYIGADRLEIDRECRSYHLGWILHSFAGRDDYPSITHHDEFRQVEETGDAA